MGWTFCSKDRSNVTNWLESLDCKRNEWYKFFVRVMREYEMEWEWRKQNNLLYLTIPQWLEWGVEVAFSTREAGVSEKPYASLNLGLHVGDDPDKVVENRMIFLSELGGSLQESVMAQQVHGINVTLVSDKDQGRGMREQISAIPDCDGLLTQDHTGLLCLYADCVPLFFYSPKTKIVALAHAGWKGTARQIVKEILARISQAGGSSDDCFAAIGPCIGACCYTVGEEVAENFRENFNEVLSKTAERKYQLDLVKANLSLLLEAGVQAEHIAIANLCTCCHPELFYSYRREGITGRMAAYIKKI